MIFGTLIGKIRKRRTTKDLVLEVVSVLRIDDKQKDLYRQAVEMLDEAETKSLYATLLETMKKFEQAEAVADFSRRSADVSGLRRKEVEARVREEHSASILLDNI